MRLALPVLLLSGFAPLAHADVVTYSTSSQTVTLTGLGVNSSGQGQSRVSWGACNFDGATTTCTVSAVYTGLGGGAISMILAYPGNGQSPLTAISQTPGSSLVFFNLSDRKSTRLNSSHGKLSRMPSSA